MLLKIIQALWLNYLAKISKMVVYGIENIPKNTNFVVAFNHDGYFDGEFVIYAFKGYKLRFFYDMPNDFSKYFLRWWYRGKGLGISYRLPNKKEINRQALNNAVNYLLRGENVALAPQGVSGDKYIESIKRPFYPGCAIISCKANRPVVPVRILNDETYIYTSEYISPLGVARRTLERIKLNVKNNLPVIVLIGKTLYPDIEKYNKNKRGYVSEFTQQIKYSIFDLENKFKDKISVNQFQS